MTVFGDGSSQRDFTYVDDIVDGLLAALDRPLQCEIINLGGAQTVRLLDLIHRIGRVVGRDPHLVFEPPQPGDVPTTWADPAKSEQLLGMAPSTGIDKGLSNYYEWLKKNP